jgi:hypothetical protein
MIPATNIEGGGGEICQYNDSPSSEDWSLSEYRNAVYIPDNGQCPVWSWCDSSSALNTTGYLTVLLNV